MATKKKVKWSLVDKQARSKLSEGRTSGIGYAFCKHKDGELTTIMPISPCKDYLSDIVYSEATGKPYRAHGLSTKKQDIYDTHAYLVMAVCMHGAREPQEYPSYKKDLAALEENYKTIQNFVNWFEERIENFGEHKTVIEKIKDNRFVIVCPLYWTKATYLISLYTLLVRSALYYKSGNPMTYLRQLKDEDAYILKNTIPKLERILKGESLPEQDFNVPMDWHNNGIVNWYWPEQKSEPKKKEILTLAAK